MQWELLPPSLFLQQAGLLCSGHFLFLAEPLLGQQGGDHIPSPPQQTVSAGSLGGQDVVFEAVSRTACRMEPVVSRGLVGEWS